jgi:hypothetical protein
MAINPNYSTCELTNAVTQGVRTGCLALMGPPAMGSISGAHRSCDRSMQSFLYLPQEAVITPVLGCHCEVATSVYLLTTICS